MAETQCYERLRRHWAPPNGSLPALPKAAVLVALGDGAGYDDDQETTRPLVLLTVRSPHLALHPGEVAFAGGKAEPGDGDSPVATALREAEEEIGLASEQVEVLTVLDPIVSRLGLLVYPVVAVLSPTFRPVASEAEVSETFWAPLALFLRSDQHRATSQWIQSEGDGQDWWIQHEFHHRGRRIWGLTANILIQVASIAFARPPAFSFSYSAYTRGRSRMMERGGSKDDTGAGMSRSRSTNRSKL